MTSTEPRDKLLRLKSQLEAISEAPGCSSCCWYREERRWDGPVRFCGHPIYCEAKADLVNGGVELVAQEVPLSLARSKEQPCGPAGLLHDRIPLHSRAGRGLARMFRRVDWVQLVIATALMIMCMVLFRRAGLFVGPSAFVLYLMLTGGILKEER